MRIYNSDGELVAVGYFITSDYIKGEYKETELDRQKKQADILLTAVEGNWYTLFLQKPIEVQGRGVKRYSDNIVVVTESVYNKLQAKYNVMCDF